ncbi:hypothetical protein HZP98_14760 [Elizabethkingia anophelis]|uniref:Uncharacterized protein n=1 Tax=Elizabethkingia anophelis TaxID=1117645 RepID=A0AAE4P155_9FLAO|nr:hypothetical protein [Elizabethkingia anophelis]MCT3746529.1 hypothetical protein [Elizabethkingia anophelis]MCT3763311.1 hypothetical protein [Elizabethkingia anophelis]MCT3920933.1 hypothetical protein [Elizabethkingia anophelis]MCT3953288.1 hypothetical protein [Elizabethkingia anophelis]MCT3956831.1 hypothetical protein [Elizabethkingia anophelis]
MRNFKRTFIAFATVLTNRISPQRQKNGIVHLRDKDHEKMKTILRAIVTKANPVNSKEHREFWKIIKKNGGDPYKIDGLEKNGDLIRILDSHMTRYAISFYEDALTTYETGTVHLSNERKELSSRVSKQMLEEDKSILCCISKRIPVIDGEDEFLFDDDLILGLLGATRNYYELIKLNINALFHEKYINRY